jgi:hypothetical protein
MEVLPSHSHHGLLGSPKLESQSLPRTTTPMDIVLVDGDVYKVFRVFAEELPLALGFVVAAFPRGLTEHAL